MRGVLGDKAMDALARIQQTLGLDYGGIDFGLGPQGDVLVFEANATMVVSRPSQDERWAYRQAGITTILDAVVAMIMQKADRDRTGVDLRSA
jgi:glutathione synthase/RimK-type ligase-like ATP-grasp enzyme